MKTLADIKREMAVGSCWRAHHLIYDKSFGERVICRRGSNFVYFDAGNGKRSRLDFPKAADVEFISDREFIIWIGNPRDNNFPTPRRPILRYCLVSSAEE